MCLMDERKEFAIKNLTNKLITKVTFKPQPFYGIKRISRCISITFT